jgi:hypothetical protein
MHRIGFFFQYMFICTILNTFIVQRFKEMREMQSSSGSRDDRQKREQQREEKELAKIAQLYPFILYLMVYSILIYVILKICIKNLGSMVDHLISLMYLQSRCS